MESNISRFFVWSVLSSVIYIRNLTLSSHYIIIMFIQIQTKKATFWPFTSFNLIMLLSDLKILSTWNFELCSETPYIFNFYPYNAWNLMKTVWIYHFYVQGIKWLYQKHVFLSNWLYFPNAKKIPNKCPECERNWW